MQLDAFVTCYNLHAFKAIQETQTAWTLKSHSASSGSVTFFNWTLVRMLETAFEFPLPP